MVRARRRLWLLLVIAFAALLLLAIPRPVEAKIIANEDGTASSSGTVDDDLYIAGQHVRVEGVINGDLYAGGQTVDIDATVNGDVIVGGQTVDVSGKMRSLRAAGQTLRITSAQISGGVTTLGQMVTLDQSTAVTGGLAVGAQSVEVKSSIGRGITGGAQQAKLDSTVGRDVELGVESLTLGSAARVSGNLSYQSAENAKLEGGAVVNGKTTRTEPENKPARRDENPAAARLGFQLWAYAASLATGLLLLWLLGPAMHRVAKEVVNKPAAAAGWGVVLLLMSVPAFIVLSLTLIGIPLAFVLAALYSVALYLAKLVVALAAAVVFAKPLGMEKVAVGWRFVLALTVFYVVAMLPVLGAVLSLAVAVLGTGAMQLALPRKAARAK